MESGIHRTHWGFSFGALQFRMMESDLLWPDLCFSVCALWVSVWLTGVGSPQDPWGFGFGALWGSVQADGIWCLYDVLGVQLWDICSSFQADRRWVTTGPCCFSFGHCGVQFRMMESCFLRTCWELSFGTFCGSVQADRRWVTTGHMCFQLWDIVGFTSGKWNLVSSEPTVASVCGIVWLSSG